MTKIFALKFARLVALSLCLSACDDGLSTPSGDLASSGADLQPVTTKLSCAATQTCIQTKCTPATLSTCAPACIAELDPAAKSFFETLAACSGPACTNGAGPCVDPGSTECATCLTQNCATEQTACLAH